MLAKIFSGTIVGLEGKLVEVEVDVASRGLPSFTLVGLPSKSIDEAKERIRTAIKNSSFSMPETRITVNLAPADIPKEGTAFDLPLAVGILAASGYVKTELLSGSFFIGELSLDGRVKKIKGALPLSELAVKSGFKRIFLPAENSKEASFYKSIEVYPVKRLVDLILHLNGVKLIKKVTKAFCFETDPDYQIDFKDIKGQHKAKRALEISAAGFHNIHLYGPPGTGKTLLARAFVSILPPMEEEEIKEVSRIYSVVGLLPKEGVFTKRPFRSPHHTTSRVGLIGGGSKPKPGEVTLAHRGVLFLDEFPEFPRSVLEALRQPIEDGEVTVSRASGFATFPAAFILLAASNPCPCGFFGHPKKPCKCTPRMILKYKRRVSGPIMDRIDLHVEVPDVESDKLISESEEEESRSVRLRVIEARKRQRDRFANKGVFFNGQMSPKDLKSFCKISEDAKLLLKQAVDKLSLSARSYFKILKISQTIADLECEDRIEPEFVAEALQYRPREIRFS